MINDKLIFKTKDKLRIEKQNNSKLSILGIILKLFVYLNVFNFKIIFTMLNIVTFNFL